MNIKLTSLQVWFAFAAVSLLSVGVPAQAQPRLLEVGIMVGTPLNDLVDAEQDDTLPLSLGGVASVNLPLGFAIEGNALYKRLGYRIDSSSFFGGQIADSRFNSWEFPVLLKAYPLGRNPVVQPFLSAGFSVRVTSGEVLGLGRNRETSTGMVLGAGLRNGPGRIKVSPEIRFTRWADRPVALTGPGGPFARLNANQLELMVGLTF